MLTYVWIGIGCNCGLTTNTRERDMDIPYNIGLVEGGDDFEGFDHDAYAWWITGHCPGDTAAYDYGD